MNSGRLAELLYGSLGQPLTRRSPCPVLLVPPGWGYREDGLAEASLLRREPARCWWPGT